MRCFYSFLLLAVYLGRGSWYSISFTLFLQWRIGYNLRLLHHDTDLTWQNKHTHILCSHHFKPFNWYNIFEDTFVFFFTTSLLHLSDVTNPTQIFIPNLRIIWIFLSILWTSRYRFSSSDFIFILASIFFFYFRWH